MRNNQQNATKQNKEKNTNTIVQFKILQTYGPVIAYGSESWITTQREKGKIQAAEIRFFRRVKECTKRSY